MIDSAGLAQGWPKVDHFSFLKVLPNREFHTFGLKWNLNPGPFNIKEHAVIVMMANVSIQGGVAYATDVLLAQQVFYEQNFGWGFQMLLVLTTQCLGFGMAGIVRRFLIWPAAMIWPQTLANTTLMYTLHDHTPANPAETNGWKIGRYRWFLYVFAGSFVWYWFPGWIAQGLTYFDWIPWIAPTNMVVNQIFGNNAGFGLVSSLCAPFLTRPKLNQALIYSFPSPSTGLL